MLVYYISVVCWCIYMDQLPVVLVLVMVSLYLSVSLSLHLMLLVIATILLLVVLATRGLLLLRSYVSYY